MPRGTNRGPGAFAAGFEQTFPQMLAMMLQRSQQNKSLEEQKRQFDLLQRERQDERLQNTRDANTARVDESRRYWQDRSRGQQRDQGVRMDQWSDRALESGVNPIEFLRTATQKVDVPALRLPFRGFMGFKGGEEPRAIGQVEKFDPLSEEAMALFDAAQKRGEEQAMLRDFQKQMELDSDDAKLVMDAVKEGRAMYQTNLEQANMTSDGVNPAGIAVDTIGYIRSMLPERLWDKFNTNEFARGFLGAPAEYAKQLWDSTTGTSVADRATRAAEQVDALREQRVSDEYVGALLDELVRLAEQSDEQEMAASGVGTGPMPDMMGLSGLMADRPEWLQNNRVARMYEQTFGKDVPKGLTPQQFSSKDQELALAMRRLQQFNRNPNR